MIYLTHPDGRIEACESEAGAIRCEARGFARCTFKAWMDGWRQKERRAQPPAAPTPAPQERAVGEKWRAPWVLRDMPKE